MPDVAARLRAELRHELPDASEVDIAVAVQQALAEFADARITAYVPILALKAARSRLRATSLAARGA